VVKDLISSTSKGKDTENAEIRTILEDAALKSAEERGLEAVLVPPSVSKRTIQNYKALAASADGASLCKKVQQKNDSTKLQRTSSCLPYSFLMVVAITHLLIGEKNPRYHKYKEELVWRSPLTISLCSSSKLKQAILRLHYERHRYARCYLYHCDKIHGA